jgi:formate hydrogenlyase subunit 4
MHRIAFLNYMTGLLLAPLVNGVINRVKARFAGRSGPPVVQPYYDLIKFLRKGAVYSGTTTWIFKASPPVSMAAALISLALVPFGGTASLIAFTGDCIVLAYMLGLMRFFTIAAALDTGSSFEGMGASREALFSALAEPAFLIGIAALAGETGFFSLSLMLGKVPAVSFELLMVVVAFVIVYLCENARIPFNDPATHLELTMVHEVMALDHGGPDFGFIQYAASIKQWILGALIVDILMPYNGGRWYVGIIEGVAAMLMLAIIIGIIESTMARLRLLRVPQLLVAAGALSTIALLLIMR